MTSGEHTALVLGAGIQGVCAALALSSRGYRVTLVDQGDGCMLRPSLRNEAKIHLGFVYANDASFRTSELMLEAALAFGPLLEEWLGPVDWNSLRSKSVTHATVNGSLLTFDARC